MTSEFFRRGVSKDDNLRYSVEGRAMVETLDHANFKRTALLETRPDFAVNAAGNKDFPPASRTCVTALGTARHTSALCHRTVRVTVEDQSRL